MKKPTSFYTIAPILADEQGKPKKEIEIMKVGTFDHPMAGRLELTNMDLDYFVASFKNGVYAKGEGGSTDKSLPVNLAHNRDGEAAGWITELIHNGDGVLRAVVDWTELGMEKLKKRLYRFVSPEWFMEYEDEEGVAHSHVLVGAGLTNIPFFKKLNPLTMSESGHIMFFSNLNMKLKDVLQKDAADLNDDEKKLVIESSEKLTDEQKTKFADILKAAEEEEDDSDEEESDEEEDDEDDTPPNDKPNTASERAKKGLLTAEEQQQLLGRVADLEKTVSASEIDKKLVPFTATATDEGQLTPKLRDMARKILLSASETQAKEFYKFIEALPKINVAGEKGARGEEDSSLTAAEKVTKMVKEFKASEAGKEMTQRQALAHVLQENPELAKEYNKTYK